MTTPDDTAHITVEELRPLAVPCASLRHDPDNARKHGAENIASIKNSLREFGVMEPVGIRNNVVIRGNATLMALAELAAEKATGLWLRDPKTDEVVETPPLDWATVPALPYQHLDDRGATRFEIRDMISWLQFQGFPKSLDVSKAIDKEAGAERAVIGQRHRAMLKSSMYAADAGGGFGEDFNVTAPATDEAKRWDGWGTALKPAIEPHVLARKPISEPTVAANVLRWGTGALNIDACRYAYGDPSWPGPSDNEHLRGSVCNKTADRSHSTTVHLPAQVAQFFDERGRWPANIYACPKPARSEREEGTDGLREEDGHETTGRTEGSAGSKHARAGRTADGMRNHHPTVKPVRLMRWLLRLVTPPGGTVVEPFGGSGTTLVAACPLDCKVIAAEREPAYCDIIRARVTHALSRG